MIGLMADQENVKVGSW